MTETLTSLRRQMETTNDLQSVVKTLKALASVNIARYQGAVDAVEQYLETIALGFQVVLRTQYTNVFTTAPPPTHTIIIMLGTDQGLVGQFNETLVNYAVNQIGSLADDTPKSICLMGSRLVPLLNRHAHSVEAVKRVPGTISGITPTVRDLLIDIEGWRGRYKSHQIILFYNYPTGYMTYIPDRVDLLPLDPSWLNDLRHRNWDSRTIPITRMPSSDLFGQLTQQYLFASLYAALAGSLASENASRLATMENAERNIKKRLETLQQRYNQKRQDTITEELFDVIAGFELLREN